MLLLDEPTASLDLGHAQQVLDLVDRLRREHGLTVLTTLHDLTLAGQYADRLALLADGRVVAAGRPPTCSPAGPGHALRRHRRGQRRTRPASACTRCAPRSSGRDGVTRAR